MGLSLKLEEEFVPGVLRYNSCGGWDGFWKAPGVEYMNLPRGRWKPLKDPVGSSAFG